MFSKKTKVHPNNKNQLKSGFTLVELLISVSVFTVVMMISMGAILSVVDANRKSQTLRSVMDNLNSSMESMNRSVRFGENYHCGTTGTLSQPFDCAGGGTSLTILDSNGSQVTFSLASNRIIKNVGGTNYYLTSTDILVQSLTFYVTGSYPHSGGSINDNLQPKVFVVIRGYVGVDVTSRSSFVLQTSISQRKFDYQ